MLWNRYDPQSNDFLSSNRIRCTRDLWSFQKLFIRAWSGKRSTGHRLSSSGSFRPNCSINQRNYLLNCLIVSWCFWSTKLWFSAVFLPFLSLGFRFLFHHDRPGFVFTLAAWSVGWFHLLPSFAGNRCVHLHFSCSHSNLFVHLHRIEFRAPVSICPLFLVTQSK